VLVVHSVLLLLVVSTYLVGSDNEWWIEEWKAIVVKKKPCGRCGIYIAKSSLVAVLRCRSFCKPLRCPSFAQTTLVKRSNARRVTSS